MNPCYRALYFRTRAALCGLILICLCNTGPAVSIPAYLSGYSASVWHADDRLPHNDVQCLAQAADGYLWVGTRAGLARFDGIRFTPANDLLVPAVPERSVTALSQGRTGGLRVATEDGSLFQGCGNRFARQPFPRKTKDDYITVLFEASDGALWMGTATNGAIRYKAGQLHQWTQETGLAHYSVRAMCEDSAGTLWIATGAGLNWLKDGKMGLITVKDGLLHNAIRALCPDGDGNLWIGSHFGLTRKHGTNYTHFSNKEGLAGNIVTAILEDRTGQIWVGTFNGLSRFSKGVLVTETQEDGAPFDQIRCLLEDADGTIWVGTRDGLFRLKPRSICSITKREGLTHNNATCVMEDRERQIWIGFWGGGLNRIGNDGVKAYTTRDGLSSDLILSLHQTRRGNIWIGMDYDGGINLWRSNHIMHVREREGLREDAVNAIHDDGRTNLWVGTRTALLAMHDAVWRRFTTSNGLPADIINAISEDKQGRIWFGTSGGLVLLDGDAFHRYAEEQGLSHPWVSSIHPGSEGVLWIGTRGGGLNRFCDGKFACYTTKDGLFNDTINGVVEDNLGFLWMSCRQGIFRASVAELNDFADGKAPRIRCTVFGKADGVASVECKGSGETAAWKARDGKLWFPTSRGVIVVDPQRIQTAARPPPAVIEQVLMNGARTDVGQLLRTVARKQEFVFRYTALNLSSPEKVQFRYRMEGLDEDWIEAGAQREARYTHVPPGRYRFCVTAANDSEGWNPEIASVSLQLLPPFWKTWWFITLTVLGATAAGAGGVHQLSVRKLQHQLRAMEQQQSIEKERMRIAQDMHDELGARVTEIMMVGDSAAAKPELPPELRRQLARISTATRELVRNLDAIVWTVNPENDSVARVAGYIEEFAGAYLESASIRCWFDYPVQLPNCPMASDVRHHLFSVFKESLNNVVKHSSAKNVRLRINLENSRFRLAVEDDGKGFEPEKSSEFGNGLKNMQRRISSVGGTFDLQSSPGRGTQILVEVPLINAKPAGQG